LPAEPKLKGRLSVVEAPAARLSIDRDGPVGANRLVLNWTTNPPAAHVPPLRTVIEMSAGSPWTGWVGANEMPVTSRSAHGVA
jgi:hypothetical protein